MTKYSPEELAAYKEEVRRHNELLTPKKVILCDSCQEQGLYYVLCENRYRWCERCNPYYWHLNPTIYEAEYYDSSREVHAYDVWKRDKDRQDLALNYGYQFIVLWQANLAANFENSIEEVLKFDTTRKGT